MKKILPLACLFLLMRFPLLAEEGMWIPMLIEQLNIKQMQDMGLRLTAEEIYSVNHSSLKDAIVQFGGGCTAEIVSAQGLILTNYHCGLGAIQRLSSMQHDYLREGFWAGSFEEELPCPGLTVTLLVRMEEVTAKILQGVDDGMSQLRRMQIIRQNTDKVEKEAVSGTRYEAKVRPFFYGNQYFLFVNEVFRDIRLAGAPPNSIGKFGGDTDNWMWPRHTGDFSVFRIYAGKDNQPADYSKDNLPYRPRNYLPVSLKGYAKNDFTFVFGYPGTTREYIPSYGVDLTAFKENPVRTGLRRLRLDIINAGMDTSQLIRIQYASKANGIANYWKKMIGETKGIRRVDAVAMKERLEDRFRQWAEASPERKVKYGNILNAFSEAYREYLPVDLSSIYITEGGQGIEVVRFASGFRDLVKLCSSKQPDPKEVGKMAGNLRTGLHDFYKNWNAVVDRNIMALMIGEMAGKMDKAYLPGIFREINSEYGEDYQAYASRVFGNSLFADSTNLGSFLGDFTARKGKILGKDPLYRLMSSIYERYEQDLSPQTRKITGRIDSLQRIYMAGLMEMQKERVFYPDANSTLRIAYGKVDDYRPADGVMYNYFTTLSGVIQKEDTLVFDYRVDPRLKQLFAAQDYGQYADRDGTMHVAFTASNHTTGGNSGSPVLNASGELIGLNFDRNWEGTLSDLQYDPEQCRNIALDIRYCLFVIDKVAGCGRLVREMKIIQP